MITLDLTTENPSYTEVRTLINLYPLIKRGMLRDHLYSRIESILNDWYELFPEIKKQYTWERWMRAQEEAKKNDKNGREDQDAWRLQMTDFGKFSI
jgi:hypothetical protein